MIFNKCGGLPPYIGIFGGGNTGVHSDYTDKYTFGDDTVVAGTVLGLARRLLSACSNPVVGIFGGGTTGAYSTYTDKYTFGDDTVVAGTVLGLARSGLSACSGVY